MSNSIYLQVQHVVWVQRLSLAGPLHCWCTELNPRSPPSWRATAASCFSTSLQRMHSETHSETHSEFHQQTLTKHIQRSQPVLQTDNIPVRSQWGRSYVPSELFFLWREKHTVMEDKTWEFFFCLHVLMRTHTCSSSAKHKPQSRWEQSEPWPKRAPELLQTPHLRAKNTTINTRWQTSLLGIKQAFFF